MDYDRLLGEFSSLKSESLQTAYYYMSLLSLWDKEKLKEFEAQDNVQEKHMDEYNDSSGNTLLHYACFNGCYNFSVKLIKEYGLNPLAKNCLGDTALHLACEFNGSLELVTCLVECYQCNPFQPNYGGYTALHYAIMMKNNFLVQYFKKSPRCGSLSTTIATDIMTIALQYSNYEIIKWLISKAGGECSLNILKLLYDCIDHEDVLLFSSIMSHCSNPNVQDENGNTVLHEICLSPEPFARHFNVLIFEKICNPTIENNKGETPLHLICSSLVHHYTNSKSQLLFYLLMNSKVSPHIKFNTNDISVLSVVCRAILEGQHTPSILHHLIIDHGCDPSNDSDIITYTLCNTLCKWDPCNTLCKRGPQSLDLLLNIITKYKPYITFGKNKQACVMCCPVECVKRSVRFGCESCFICLCYQCWCSYHYSIQCPGQVKGSKCDCTLFSKLLSILTHFDFKNNAVTMIDFLFYCYSSITCDCGFHGNVIPLLKSLPFHDLSPNVLVHIIKSFGSYLAISSANHAAMLSCLCQINEYHSPSLVDSNVYTLCQQNPLQAASVIICDIKPYSSTICYLFYYILNHCELDLMSKVDVFDNTLLHLACLFYHGNSTLIEYLLSTGKTDPLCVNCYQQTPLTLLSLSSKKHSGNQLNVHKLIAKFGKAKISHPIESYVNVVVLGDPGVGKSTLVKVLNDRHELLFSRFRSVSGVELYTAGIVPHVLNDKDMGRIIVHDLAGQVEYYSSHTAVLENLLQGSAAVFVIVVSLAKGELTANALQFWISIVNNVSHKALRQCQAMIVTSYADVGGTKPLLLKLQSILDQTYLLIQCSPPFLLVLEMLCTMTR